MPGGGVAGANMGSQGSLGYSGQTGELRDSVTELHIF